MTASSDSDFITRHEAELLSTMGESTSDIRLTAHSKEHDHEQEAVKTARESDREQQREHNTQHDRAHESHEEKHDSTEKAVDVALEAVGRERGIHAEAHEREHEAHLREHGLVEKYQDKIDKLQEEARQLLRENTDERLRTAEDARRILGESLVNKSSLEKVDALADRIVNLEKVDVESKGRGLGQGATIAYIVTAISVTGGLLSITILLINLLAAS